MSNRWLVRHALAFAISTFFLAAQAGHLSASEGNAPADNSHAGAATMFSKSTLSYRTNSGKSLVQTVSLSGDSLVIDYVQSSNGHFPQRFRLEAPISALTAAKPVEGPIDDVPTLKRVYVVMISCRSGNCMTAATPTVPSRHVNLEVVFDNEKDADTFYRTVNGR